MPVAAAACFFISLILFLALLESSVELPLELLVAPELPDLDFEEPDPPLTELPLPESP